MAGQTHSPGGGSYLVDFVDFGKRLGVVKENPEPDFWLDIGARLARVEARLERAESCVTEYLPDQAEPRH